MSTETTLTVKERIKVLLSQIKDKTTLAGLLSEIYEVEPNTIRNHWFGPLTSVPKKHRDSLLEYLQNYPNYSHE